MKKGIFTSEFWMTLVSGIVVAICDAFGLSSDIKEAILKLVLAYIGSRTIVKATNNIRK